MKGLGQSEEERNYFICNSTRTKQRHYHPRRTKICASLQPISACCTFHPGKQHNFKAECLPRTLSGSKLHRGDSQKWGARRGNKEIGWYRGGWLGAKIWQFFQGEYCIFPINFLTAKVSTFQSTVKLYILPSTHKQLSRHEAQKNILYRGHSETEGHFLF